MGAREVGPWVSDQKPLGKTPLGGNPSPEMTYLPTYLCLFEVFCIAKGLKQMAIAMHFMLALCSN